MNGIHDMGGMQDMGPIEREENEPVFHEPWEGRVYAMNRAIGCVAQVEHRRRPLRDRTASSRRLSAHELLREMAGAEHGVAGGARLGDAGGDGNRQACAGIAEGNSASYRRRRIRGGHRTAAISCGRKRRPRLASKSDSGPRAEYQSGGPHALAPIRERQRRAVVVRHHGIFVFPDTNAHFLGEQPQHLYSVRFAARELWGEDASPRDSVYIDLWDSYLEHA